jgi:hypothetical protein
MGELQVGEVHGPDGDPAPVEVAEPLAAALVEQAGERQRRRVAVAAVFGVLGRCVGAGYRR